MLPSQLLTTNSFQLVLTTQGSWDVENQRLFFQIQRFLSEMGIRKLSVVVITQQDWQLMVSSTLGAPNSWARAIQNFHTAQTERSSQFRAHKLDQYRAAKTLLRQLHSGARYF